VLAGPNGAGKSSLGGATLRALGADYFDPDEATQRVLVSRPDLTLESANGLAWNQGRRLLETAIRERLDYAFETTLGGTTIARLLHGALDRGLQVRIWYVALATADLHVERVRARVARGGHDVAEAKIRERYDRSRRNLIGLLPRLSELKVLDNSPDRDPARGRRPEPLLVLHAERGSIREVCRLEEVPEWAKPIVVESLRIA
jgi:predicted ABC-type ATPase